MQSKDIAQDKLIALSTVLSRSDLLQNTQGLSQLDLLHGAIVIRKVASAKQTDVCEALVQALGAFGKVDLEVAVTGCRAIITLAQDEANRAKLGEIGACAALAQALQEWGTLDADFAYVGCAALANLALKNGANSAKLMDSCETLVQVLKHWGQENLKVAKAGCGAMIYLAAQNHAHTQKFDEVGAGSAVMPAFDAWGQHDKHVAWAGCWMVAVSKTVSILGACEAVTRALSMWGPQEKHTARVACLALMRIAEMSGAASKIKLGHVGACDVIVQTLTTWGTTEPKISKFACRTIWALAQDPANRAKLHDAGAGEAVTVALDARPPKRMRF